MCACSGGGAKASKSKSKSKSLLPAGAQTPVPVPVDPGVPRRRPTPAEVIDEHVMEREAFLGIKPNMVVSGIVCSVDDMGIGMRIHKVGILCALLFSVRHCRTTVRQSFQVARTIQTRGVELGTRKTQRNCVRM